MTRARTGSQGKGTGPYWALTGPNNVNVSITGARRPTTRGRPRVVGHLPTRARVQGPQGPQGPYYRTEGLQALQGP